MFLVLRKTVTIVLATIGAIGIIGLTADAIHKRLEK